MNRKAAALVFIWMFCLSAAPRAQAPKAAAPNAEAIIVSLYKRTSELQKYKLMFDYVEAKNEKSKGASRTCEFWYAGPDLIRLAVREGDDKGSKVVYNAKKNDKAVKVKQLFIAISLKKTDPRLAGFFVSDWLSDLNDVKKFTAGAKPKLGGEDKIKGRAGYKVEFTGLKGEFDKVLLWIDEKDSVLLQYEYYSGGVFKQRKTWYDYDLNPAITDADFKI